LQRKFQFTAIFTLTTVTTDLIQEDNLPEKPIVTQLTMKSSITSLSQQPVTETFPEPDEANPDPHFLFI